MGLSRIIEVTKGLNEQNRCVWKFSIDEQLNIVLEEVFMQGRKTPRHKWQTDSSHYWSRLMKRDCTMPKPSYLPDGVAKAAVDCFRDMVQIKAGEFA